jgi:hypothetical protein
VAQLDDEFTGLTFVLPDGTECPITNMMDREGEDTDDPDLAYAIVALNPVTGEWMAREVGSATRRTVYH